MALFRCGCFIIAAFVVLCLSGCGTTGQHEVTNLSNPPCGFQPATEWDVAPEIVKMAKAVYPEMARRKGEEGTVCVAVWLGVTGSVLNAELHKSSGSVTLDRQDIENDPTIGELESADEDGRDGDHSA